MVRHLAHFFLSTRKYTRVPVRYPGTRYGTFSILLIFLISDIHGIWLRVRRKGVTAPVPDIP